MTPLEVLQKYWGYSAFRPLQESIIGRALDGQDTLALLPTGGGKSLCFQVPALCRQGLCIVVSPLIALMRDQVDNLLKRQIPAAAIYSGMSRREIDLTLERACQGGYKLLYVSPERLQTDLFLGRLERMQVNLLAVDEAHCISQWGYDFRPPYLQIAELRDMLPGTPMLALTATATPEVANDIQEKLLFREKHVIQQSFQRANLSYSVLYEEDKRRKLLDILRKVPGTSVVYVRSRGDTKEVALWLAQLGISADFYHAGLTTEERTKRQADWIANRTRVIVCTNAFGMGIDKPDVRTVVHLGLPDSLEAYFQEAGRAGRDGLKSWAVLLYNSGDAAQLRRHFESAYPALSEVRRVYAALGNYLQLAIGAGKGASFPFDFQQFCQNSQIRQSLAHQAIKLLEQEGWISLSDVSGSLSRVQILANRETLYDYQLRNKQGDIVIKALLRTYSGIRDELCEISEAAISRFANQNMEAVRQTLKHAASENILFYREAVQLPELCFLRARVAPEDLSFDTQRRRFLMDRTQKRLEAAIAYAETRRCRSQQLRAYFGEKNSDPCGICDVCTGRNEADINAETYKQYEKKILELLRKEALSVPQILEAFAPKRHKTVLSVLKHMNEEGKLKSAESGVLSVV